MKQYLIFSLMLLAVSSVSAQFKTVPGQKTPPVNQEYLKSLKITPEVAESGKEANKNLGNALLTASVGAALGVAGVCGGLKGSNGNRNMGRGGISLAQASGYYFKQAQKQRQGSVEQAISPGMDNKN